MNCNGTADRADASNIRMTEKAYAKINYALRIIGRRGDGYHLLDMLMQSISLCDELTVEPDDHISLTIPGSDIVCGTGNLVWKAAERLNEYFGTHLGAKMTLIKRIPSQAGLGGGSADCAAALRLLPKLWHREIPREELMRIALSLGADVPFCMEGGCARVGGIGERIEPVEYTPGVPLVIVKPEEGVPTGQAFRLFDEMTADGHENVLENSLDMCRKALCNGKWEELRGIETNDLAAPACRIVPKVRECIDRLYAMGAKFAAMSGSGSAVFGVFENERQTEDVCDVWGTGAYVCRTV